MKVVEIPATSGSPDSPAWHAWRALGIGGSDAVIVAAGYGIIPRRDVPSWVAPLDELLAIKRGEQVEKERDDFSQYFLDRGRNFEARVREAYEAITGVPVSPIFGENEEYPFIRASFDGLSIDGLRIVEIKVPGQKAVDLARQGLIPVYYRAQLAHQAMTAWGVDPSLWPEDAVIDYVTGFSAEDWQDPIILTIRAQELAPLARDLFAAEKDFWATVEGDGLLHGPEYAALVAAYDEAEAALKAAEARLGEAKERLRAFYDAQPFPRVEGAGRALDMEVRPGGIDYAAVLVDKGIRLTPEEEERYRKKPVVSFTIRSRGNPLPRAALPAQNATTIAVA
jgi:putative phage-type endonuclease